MEGRHEPKLGRQEQPGACVRQRESHPDWGGRTDPSFRLSWEEEQTGQAKAEQEPRGGLQCCGQGLSPSRLPLHVGQDESECWAARTQGGRGFLQRRRIRR